MQSALTDIQGSPLNLNAIYNNNELKFSPKTPFNYYSASHPIGKLALPYANGHQPARKNELTHQPSKSKDVTDQPINTNEATLQPTSGREITSQPTRLNDLSRQPNIKNDVTHQPVIDGRVTHQPTIKTELIYSAVDFIYRRLLTTALHAVTTDEITIHTAKNSRSQPRKDTSNNHNLRITPENSGSSATHDNNRDSHSFSELNRKAQSVLPDQLLTQSETPEILFGYPDKSWNIWQVL